MPVISINKSLLFKLLGKEYEQSAFEDLCFDFGVELDDVVANPDGSIDYKIEIPANRYDLVSCEGFVRALRFFIGLETELCPFRTVTPPNPVRLTIKQSVVPVRRYAVCAVLRNVTFTQDSYDSFIDLQEKLHWNVCRKRVLASVGTHDLDTLTGPFEYSAQDPNLIQFVPLNQEASVNGHEMVTLLSKHEQLKNYLPIISHLPAFPVIHDASRVVLSVPPIINGNHSKITLKTRNVLIEVTATDATKAAIVLDTICTTFSQYCDRPYEVEQVEVVDESTGATTLTPQFPTRSISITLEALSRGIGVPIDKDLIPGYLLKMMLSGRVTEDGTSLEVAVTPNRTDLLHACDVLEDVAIAYGYNRLLTQATPPPTLCKGVQQPLNKFSDKLRLQLALASYMEVLTFSLCSQDENYAKLRQPDDGQAVVLANPATQAFEVVRTTLYPGLLKTLKNSKSVPLPIKIFEVSDVVTLDSASDVGASNTRCLCALHLATGTHQFEVIHGLVDRLMLSCGIQFKEVAQSGDQFYYIKAASSPLYLENRCAEVVVVTPGQGETALGLFGILRPDVLANFDIRNGLAGAVHLDVEKLFGLYVM